MRNIYAALALVLIAGAAAAWYIFRPTPVPQTQKQPAVVADKNHTKTEPASALPGASAALPGTTETSPKITPAPIAALAAFPASPSEPPAVSAAAAHNNTPDTAPATQPDEVPPVLNFTMKDIHGNDVPLSKYRGKVVLIVNVASLCGYTIQYEQLEALHEKYSPQGLTILAFPANNFGHQEPGTDEKIQNFCRTKYDVKFDLFSKISVVDPTEKDDQGPKAPLYKFLTSPNTNGKFAGEIKWNFTKFLVGRDGKVVARYEPAVKPNAETVIADLETELAKPAP